MRIPSQFAKRMRTLFNRLRRESGAVPDEGLTDPAEQLILSILATDANTRRARGALHGLLEEMIDFNELRVTPAAELADLLEPNVKGAPEKAQAIVGSLSWLFNKFDTMDLSGLREQQQSALLATFETIPECPDHARKAMLLLSFGVPVFPVDQQMLDYLKAAEVLPEEVAAAEAQHYVERQLKAAEVREFYLLVKAASESAAPPAKPKAKAVKKTAAKSKTAKTAATARKKTTAPRSRK